jgi:dUTPase
MLVVLFNHGKKWISKTARITQLVLEKMDRFDPIHRTELNGNREKTIDPNIMKEIGTRGIGSTGVK